MKKSDTWKRMPLSAAIIIVIILVIGGAVAFTWPLKSQVVVQDRGNEVATPRTLEVQEVQVADLPAIAEAISRASAPVRYAALIFSAPDRPSEQDVLNLQLSFENGKLGFDWVLLAPRNIEDQEKFRAFARARGFEPVAQSSNGVSYLRVENDDVAQFAASVVTDLYRYPNNGPMGLVHEGFEWPRS